MSLSLFIWADILNRRMSMTENEKRLNKLIYSLIDLVDIVEYSETISRKEFLELDSAGTEIIDCIEELKLYRAIGTIEDFKALKEKAEPKKPQEISWGATNCPICGQEFGFNSHFNHCPNCGQKLDFGKEE